VDASEVVYATAVHPSEVSGYGSAASWHAGPPEPPVGQQPTVSGRTELARYRVSSGARVLYRQRIAGGLQITDRPASRQGRSFIVEAGLELDGDSALAALVRDYIEQAGRLDEIPMASSVIRRELEQVMAPV
jgi:hypothetical protein